jgi:hypothetical protein
MAGGVALSSNAMTSCGFNSSLLDASQGNSIASSLLGMDDAQSS